jgi:arsenate reductase (thioredoxin)
VKWPLIAVLLFATGCQTSVPPPKPVLKPKIAFICVENSNRSQMAEAFARMHGGDRVEIYSAGSKPSGKVNLKAIEMMKERGYDLTKHTSKGVDTLPDSEFDAIVTMGCGDACPNVKAKRRIDWPLPDPKTLPPEEFRQVRDEIERRVKELLQEVMK